MDKLTWLGVQKALDQFSREYNLLTRILSFGQAEKFRQKIIEKIKPTDTVLEIGCGPGVLANMLNVKKYVGVDPLDSMINIAKLSVQKPNVEFMKGYAEKLPFENEKFDAVVCSFSFRDFINKDKALKEIYRVLKRGGKLIILDIPGCDNAQKVAVSLFYMVSGLLLTLTILDKRYLTLKDFVKSIWKMPSFKELINKLLEQGFRKIKFQLYILGIVFMIEAIK